MLPMPIPVDIKVIFPIKLYSIIRANSSALDRNEPNHVGSNMDN